MYAANIEKNCRPEHAIAQIPRVTVRPLSLPTNGLELSHYLERLLTPGEKQACSQATD